MTLHEFAFVREWLDQDSPDGQPTNTVTLRRIDQSTPRVELQCLSTGSDQVFFKVYFDSIDEALLPLAIWLDHDAPVSATVVVRNLLGLEGNRSTIKVKRKRTTVSIGEGK